MLTEVSIVHWVQMVVVFLGLTVGCVDSWHGGLLSLADLGVLLLIDVGVDYLLRHLVKGRLLAVLRAICCKVLVLVERLNFTDFRSSGGIGEGDCANGVDLAAVLAAALGCSAFTVLVAAKLGDFVFVELDCPVHEAVIDHLFPGHLPISDNLAPPHYQLLYVGSVIVDT